MASRYLCIAGIGAVFILILCMCLVSLYIYRVNGLSYIQSDGTGYYSYLPSFILYKDKTMAKYVEESQGKQFLIGIQNSPLGGYFTKYPMGTALLELPFFGAAALFSTEEQRKNPFAYPFDFSVRVAALVALLAGLAVWGKGVLDFRDVGICGVFIFVLALLSTNILHYAIHDGSFSHIYSLFLFSLLIYLANKQGSCGVILLVSFVLALIFLVRFPNILYALLYLFIRPQPLLVRHVRLRWIVFGAIVFAATVSLQVVYYVLATGKFLPDTYPGEHFTFVTPQVVSFLFSVKKGLFFWHPSSLLMILISIYALFSQKQYVFVMKAMAILITFVYISSSWECWWYGYSFGQRVFVEMYPFLFFLFGYALQYIKRQRIVLVFVFACLCAHNVVVQYGYWFGTIHGDSASWEQIERAYSLFPGFMHITWYLVKMLL